MIDFGLSRRYEDVGPHLELPGWGGDKTVPEFRTGELYDPFLVDVYCLGNVVREYFTQVRNISRTFPPFNLNILGLEIRTRKKGVRLHEGAGR
jgi:hypothetical protein